MPFSGSRNEATQRQAATELVGFIEVQERDLTIKNLELFWGELNRCVIIPMDVVSPDCNRSISKLVKSPSSVEKFGGILAIGTSYILAFRRMRSHIG